MIGIKIQNSFLQKTILSFLEGRSEIFDPQHFYQVIITDSAEFSLSQHIPVIFLGKKSKYFLTFPFKLSELEKILAESYITYENKFFLWNSKYRQLKNKKTKKTIQLTEKEGNLIDFLCTSPKHQATKEELLKYAWQYTENVETHTIETTLYALRKKLKKDADYLIVFKKLNYQLV